jgi:hypothetical protein
MVENYKNEEIFESAPSEPDDEFWLEQGTKMIADSIPSIRSAADSVIKALGALQSVWLGILGFAKIIPESWPVLSKAFFVVPFLFWMPAMYFCVQIMATQLLNINPNSPSDIREQTTQLVIEKQVQLEKALLYLFLGIIAAFVLVVIRVKM